MKVGTDGVLLGAWAAASQPSRILDIGTGTGLIALMLAQRFPIAIVDAVEIDRSACQQAQENFHASPWRSRLNAIAGCIQEFSTDPNLAGKYSLIVSNPPWFRDSFKSGEPARNTARHMDALSTEDLLEAVLRLLNDNGRFATILPSVEGLRLLTMAALAGLHCDRRCDVYPTAERPSKRLLLEFTRRHSQDPVISERLVVKSAQRHNYTPEYRALTSEFYLRF